MLEMSALHYLDMGQNSRFCGYLGPKTRIGLDRENVNLFLVKMMLQERYKNLLA